MPRPPRQAGEYWWRYWVDAALAGGAKAAHRFVREPAGWTPTITTPHDGVVTAEPAALLQAEYDNYTRVWEAGGTLPDIGLPWLRQRSFPCHAFRRRSSELLP